MAVARLARALPRTLWGRVLLVVLSGLLIAHAASIAFATYERHAFFRQLQARNIAERILEAMNARPPASPSAMPPPAFGRDMAPRIRAHPPPAPGSPGPGRMPFGSRAGPPIGWRIVDSLPDPDPDARAAPRQVEREIRDVMEGALGQDSVVRVVAREPDPPELRADVLKPQPWGGVNVRRIDVALRLPDGRHGLAEAQMLEPPLHLPTASWISVALIFLLTTAFSLWAARLAVRPVRTLAQAAERLSRNLDEPALREEGPLEIRDAARAFNRLQERLRRHVRTRSLAFAAMSHDMRTPLTRLQLRIEDLEDGAMKEKLRADLDEIGALAQSSLEVTRGLSQEEPSKTVDLGDLVHSVAQDFAAMGHRIEVAGSPRPLAVQPKSLRRALANLVDNAIRHGKDVSIELADSEQRVEIRVLDRGPGVAETELPRVTQPYYRIEGSRSRETGGAGLGLAIALDIVESQGGELILANREGGGLVATVTLPRLFKPRRGSG